MTLSSNILGSVAQVQFKDMALIDAEFLAKARHDLEIRAAAISEVRLEKVTRKDFSFGQIRSGIDRREIRDWLLAGKSGKQRLPAIYRLTVNDLSGADRIQSEFRKYRSTQATKLPRLNNVTDSTTIYVGSSRSLENRMEQHLVTAPKATYALKLREWCPDADFSISVEAVRLLYEKIHIQLQDIEDALWRKDRPMFGKVGSR